MGVTMFTWTLTFVLWSFAGDVIGQYTNLYNYLDIYPRLDFTFGRKIPQLDNATKEKIHYFHHNVMVNLDNMRAYDELVASLPGGVVSVDYHSTSGRHMYHSPLKTERMSHAEYYENYFETLTRELQPLIGKVTYPIDYEGPVTPPFCYPRHNYPCPEDARYRTIDGTCNNHKHPSWGSSVSCYRRFLPAAYSDGISAFRLDYYGDDLPNPRLLSNYLHYHEDVQARTYTQFLNQWGQWVAHDITLVKSYLAAGQDVLDCCRGSRYQPYSMYNNTLYQDSYQLGRHPQCRPIYMPHGEEFYPPENCINFVRNAACPSCKIGPRDQTNKATSYLDASNVYGSSQETLQYLRDPHDPAKLAVQQTSYGYMLPRSRHPNVDQCSFPHASQYCFAAGDSRSNQHPGLSILHTTWVRYHNSLVDIFRYLNPHWNYETLFEEVRRVVAAQNQFITYREYIHILLGPTLMTYFDLWTLKHGHTFYAEVLDAGTFNEVSAAVYRYGHSLVGTEWWRVNTTSMEVMSYLDLKDQFFSSDYLYSQPYDELLLGMVLQPSMKFDHHVTSTLTQYVYRVKGEDYGLDLASLNVYRGRDHGLQGYTRYLEACYGVQVNSFQDLLPFMSRENVYNLERVYKHVTDIDLWTGGLHEKLLRDAVVGPTFGCIIGLQYYFLKFGDRFYVEHGGLPSSFTDRQLTEIRKTWFSYIMCKTGDNIYYTTLDVFQPASEYNPILPCSQIPEPDWNAWFEVPGHGPGESLNEY